MEYIISLGILIVAIFILLKFYDLCADAKAIRRTLEELKNLYKKNS